MYTRYPHSPVLAAVRSRYLSAKARLLVARKMNAAALALAADGAPQLFEVVECARSELPLAAAMFPISDAVVAGKAEEEIGRDVEGVGLDYEKRRKCMSVDELLAGQEDKPEEKEKPKKKEEKVRKVTPVSNVRSPLTSLIICIICIYSPLHFPVSRPFLFPLPRRCRLSWTASATRRSASSASATWS